MFELGALYERRMQPPDLDAARHWYERAADAGNSARHDRTSGTCTRG